MELPPGSSYDVLAYAQAEDEAKYLEQYLAQLVPPPHIAGSRPPYIRGLGYLPPAARPTLIANGNPPHPAALPELPADPSQAMPWPHGLHQFGWRASEPPMDRGGPRNVRGGSSFGASAGSTTQLFKKPMPDPEETQLAREDSVVMDGLSDPNEPLAPQKKATSLQEKNRRAQKRFREKQKVKMMTLETQVQDLSTNMFRLAAENESLRNRNSVLEKVLKLRDEQIAVLQEKAKLFERPDAEPTTSASSGQRPSGAVAGTSAGAGTSSRGAGGEEGPFTAEVVSKMTPNDVIQLWKDYLKQLSSWVVQAETEAPDPAVVQRVEDIITEAGKMCTRVAILNPICIKKLVSSNLEDASAGEATPQHWTTVLGALALTEEQKKEVLAARGVFLEKLRAVVEERQRINTQLQHAVPDGDSVAPQGGGNNRTTAISLEAHDALALLKENLRREHNIHWEFNAGMFGKVLTKLQVAKAAVHSYPYYPDALGIANIIALQMDALDHPVIDVP